MLNVGCVNDVWRVTISLDISSMPVPSWEPVEVTGTPPEPRYGHSATLLPKPDKIVIVGGQDTTIQFNDVHLLSSDGAAWSQPTVSGTPPMVRMLSKSLSLPSEKTCTSTLPAPPIAAIAWLMHLDGGSRVAGEARVAVSNVPAPDVHRERPRGVAPGEPFRRDLLLVCRSVPHTQTVLLGSGSQVQTRRAASPTGKTQ